MLVTMTRGHCCIKSFDWSGTCIRTYSTVPTVETLCGLGVVPDELCLWTQDSSPQDCVKSSLESAPNHTMANAAISRGVFTAPPNSTSKTCCVVAQTTKTSAGMYLRIFSTQLSGWDFVDSSGTSLTSPDTVCGLTAPGSAEAGSSELMWPRCWRSRSTAWASADASCLHTRLLRIVRGMMYRFYDGPVVFKPARTPSAFRCANHALALPLQCSAPTPQPALSTHRQHFLPSEV
jgi:hypothetical protein